MEYIEAPSIENIERRFVYSALKWLNKAKFEERLELERASPNSFLIHPYIDPVEGESNLNTRLFVGRTIPNSRSLTVELLGTVFMNTDGKWQLNVTYGCAVTQVRDDFLVLNIEDPQAFVWLTTSGNSIPSNALRAAIDNSTREYLYVGKSIPNEQTAPTPSFFLNGHWEPFDEPLPPVFGKVHRSHKCLYAPVNNLELYLSKYQILCLRPSPASLKILCRSVIRSAAHNSNRLIERINVPQRRLPDSLLKQFVMYPKYLTVGDYMLPGEKIMSENGEVEMIIEKEDLICREADGKLNVVIERWVNSVWLHPWRVILLHNNQKLECKEVFNHYDYRLTIDNYAHTCRPCRFSIVDANGSPIQANR